MILEPTTSSSFNVNDALQRKAVERPSLRRSRPGVSFHDRVQIIEFEKPTEYTRGIIWYRKDEYDIIKARNSLIVKMTKSGSFEESEEHSFRGLEHKLKEGFRIRRLNKIEVLRAVIEEQERQVDCGVNDPELVAEASRKASLTSREKGLYFGMKDSEHSYAYNADKCAKAIAALRFDDSSSDSEPSLGVDSDSQSDSSAEDCSQPPARGVLGLFGAAQSPLLSAGDSRWSS